MNCLLIRNAPLETLENLLPRFLQNVSLSRAQIAIDQLRGAIQTAGRDRVVLVTAAKEDQVVAAAVAIQQPGVDQEMATVIHAGSTLEADDDTQIQWMEGIRPALENELIRRGVRFAQWATDSGAINHRVALWCQALGFQSVGTLDYLKGDVHFGANHPVDKSSLLFNAIEWEDSDGFDSFVRLVEQTYRNTLDCPKLANFRTAAETLQGYRASAAYDPTGWFRIVDQQESGEQETIGCLILGLHRPAEGDPVGKPVLEVVYMGIIPTARGRGLGKQIIERALAVASQRSAKQIILAVDQRNQPARNIYVAAGMTEMLSETVWVRSLG